MLFDQINLNHIRQAVAVFEEKGYPEGLSESAYYNILFKGKEYPPKPIMAYANEIATGTKPGNYFEGGYKKPAFNQLEYLGIPIIEKNAHEKLLPWIQKYKDLLREPEKHQYNEWYKWRAFEHFKSNWPSALEKNNIKDALSNSFLTQAANLWSGSHYLPLKVLQEIAESNPEQVASMISELFNEDAPVDKRLIDFSTAAEKAFSLLRPGENLDHYQSDRAMSLYLSLRFPEKYYLYKAGMYIDFCTKTGFVDFPKSRKGIPFKKTLHFYEVAEFIKSFLLLDNGLLELHRARREDYISFDDDNLLTQDFIYGVANYMDEKEDIASYWIFQGNPKVFDFKSALADETLNDWTVSAHKKEIKPGDKVILWITGSQAGCYALAEVLSEPYTKSSSEDDPHWIKPSNNDLRADIKITHNLKDKPILWESIKGLGRFENFKAGSQGTNFSATKLEYEYFEKMSGQDNFQVWIYAPGEKAHKWEELYKSGEMALGWDDLGDLSQYSSRDHIKEALDKHYPKKGDRKNDLSANDDFLNKMKMGDLVISKKGRKELLGYGWVTSDYFHNDKVSSYTSRRKVNWQLKGSWKTDHDLVLKTLTDLTKYTSDEILYKKYYEKLLDTMGVNLNGPHHQNAFYDWLKSQFGSTGTPGSYIKAIQFLSKTLNKKIFTIEDQSYLNSLYADLVDNQRDQNGKYFNKDAPESYGAKGFYSASIKAYQEYLQGKEKHAATDNHNAQNLILYGPPGTGKTFKLKEEFFPNYSVKETSLSADEHFTEVVQDLSWFQVIALALLEEGRSKVQAILENRWVRAKDALSFSKNVRATLWGSLQAHTVRDCEYVNYKSRTEPLLFNKDQNSYWELVEGAIEEQSPELLDIKSKVDDFEANPDQEIKRYVFTTFHQAFNYEDFIEGIKPVMDQEEGSELSYRIEDGVFKRICKRAANDPQNRYAIFIDEINRGNIANIFGELITLIELDKRKGMPSEMSVTLPYSKQAFTVPSNLDIIGTMNTADRSVEALDTALRRRFNFQEMLPQPDLLRSVLGDNAIYKDIDLEEVLRIVNLRIEKLIDRDHSIGHAYFLKLKSHSDQKEALIEIFCDNIIPLLQEYFYNDYPKIGLVLGRGFIDVYKEDESKQAVKFADFEADGSEDYLDRPLFRIKSKNELAKDDSLAEALNMLLS